MQEVGKLTQRALGLALGDAQAILARRDLLFEISALGRMRFPLSGVEFFLPSLLMLVSKPIGFIELRSELIRRLMERNDSVDVDIDMPSLAALCDLVASVLKGAGVEHRGEGKHTPHSHAMNRGRGPEKRRFGSGRAARSRRAL